MTARSRRCARAGSPAPSARTIAVAAEVNQALVFYHFGTVDTLVDAACREATAERVSLYRDRFRGVGSLRELLALGREIYLAERSDGNVAVRARRGTTGARPRGCCTALAQALGG